MTLLRDGRTVEDPRLDRLPSTVTTHLEKFPLTASTMPEKPSPVVIGVNWYDAFDRPEIRVVNGRSVHVIGTGPLGSVRGGHAVCLKPHGVIDSTSWWRFYDQGVEGRCVEFAWLRCMTLYNRRRYDITSRWHYWRMQMSDEWAGGSYPGATPAYEGTSVRAGGEVMRSHGAVRARYRGLPISYEKAEEQVRQDDGIAVYRWASSWDDVRSVTGTPDSQPGVIMLNSWGVRYPQKVLIPDAVGERLLSESGEFGVPTDR